MGNLSESQRLGSLISLKKEKCGECVRHQNAPINKLSSKHKENKEVFKEHRNTRKTTNTHKDLRLILLLLDLGGVRHACYKSTLTG